MVKREKFPDADQLEVIDEDDVLLSKRDVAALLGCCPRTVMRMCHRGQLPHPIVFNSQMYRWSRQAIRDFLRELREATEGGA